MKNIVSRKYGPRDFTAGQIHEMLVTLGKAGFSPEMAAIVANAKFDKAEEIVGLFPFGELPEDIARWQKFYCDYFWIKMNFINLYIPRRPASDWRLLIMVDLLLEEIAWKYRELKIPYWQYYNDLDVEIVRNDRTAQSGPYAIWVRDRQEADEELKNLSASKLAEMKISTETLAERMIHGLTYYLETGQHLDIKNITLCGGSRAFLTVMSRACTSIRAPARSTSLGILLAMPLGFCAAAKQFLNLLTLNLYPFSARNFRAVFLF